MTHLPGCTYSSSYARSPTKQIIVDDFGLWVTWSRRTLKRVKVFLQQYTSRWHQQHVVENQYLKPDSSVYMMKKLWQTDNLQTSRKQLHRERPRSPLEHPFSSAQSRNKNSDRVKSPLSDFLLVFLFFVLDLYFLVSNLDKEPRSAKRGLSGVGMSGQSSSSRCKKHFFRFVNREGRPESAWPEFIVRSHHLQQEPTSR